MRHAKKIFGCSIIIAFSIAYVAFFRRHVPGPLLAADRDQIDFGRVTPGEVVERDFTIRNDGSKNLHIQDVFPDCGCTLAKISRNDLSPGESAPLHVTFNTKGFSRSITKRIAIICNSIHGNVILKLSGYIKFGSRPLVDTLDCGSARAGESVDSEFVCIRDTGESSVAPVITNSADNISISVGAWTRDGDVESCKVNVGLKHITGAVGEHRSHVVVHMGGNDYPVELTYHVVPRVTWSPEFPMVDGDKQLNLHFTSRNEKFQVASATSRFGKCDCKIDEIDCIALRQKSTNKPPKSDFDLLRCECKFADGSLEVVEIPVRLCAPGSAATAASAK